MEPDVINAILDGDLALAETHFQALGPQTPVFLKEALAKLIASGKTFQKLEELHHRELDVLLELAVKHRP